MQPSVVEPVDVLQGGQFEIVEATPRPTGTDEFGLVEPVEALRQGVDAPIVVKPR